MLITPFAVCIHFFSPSVRSPWTKRWQETDYRNFRINFIQFMRTPPAAAADGPELVPVEIVAESKPTPGQENDEEKVQDSVRQPVVVDPSVYEGARATEKVCAWPVQEEDEPEDAAAAAVVVVTTSEPKKSMSSFSLSDSDDTSPPTPPSEEPGYGGESDDSIETAAGISCPAAAASPEPPTLSPASSASPLNDSSVGGFPARDGEGDDCPTAAGAEGLSTNGGAWDEQETNRRGCCDSGNGSTCSLGWSSVDDEGNDADEEEEEEADCDGNTVRMGRSFSNLETARRGGAGLSTLVPCDSSDSDESSSDGADSEMGGRESRPRALSLDGWFTCGLENGVDSKTYETHDHAGRLRDLVLLVSWLLVSVSTSHPSPSSWCGNQPSYFVAWFHVLRGLRWVTLPSPSCCVCCCMYRTAIIRPRCVGAIAHAPRPAVAARPGPPSPR